MRRFLDLIYTASGGLAAAFVVAICAVVLLQVGANVLDSVIAAFTGGPIGLVVPSYAEFAGFFLAAASFLALAHTLRHGGHIRVSLLIQHLTGRRRRWVEMWCLAAAAVMSGYFCVFVTDLMLQSLRFGDLSYGMVPVPLWIPQASLVIGAAVLTLALVDDLVCVLRGREPSYERAASPLEEPEAGLGPPPGD